MKVTIKDERASGQVLLSTLEDGAWFTLHNGDLLVRVDTLSHGVKCFTPTGLIQSCAGNVGVYPVDDMTITIHR